jgi:RHS repeat-associated protein
VPVFGAASDTPVPIGAGQVDAEGLLPDYSADVERRTQSFPLVDTVRRWTAPYDGTVSVTGSITLDQVEGKLPAFAKPDGVRVAIQHKATEVWSATIAANDHGERAPQGVDAIQVNKGDHLYFRVGSVLDGAADQVSWNPRITYANLPETADANGLSLNSYTASEDFTLAGRAATVTAPKDGTLTLSGAVTKSAATTDDLTVVVTRAGETVFEQALEAAFTGEVPVNAKVSVTQGQALSWRIKADSPIDVTALRWAPTARYSVDSSVPEGYEQTFNALYDIDTYSPTGAAPQQPYAASGPLTVTPQVTAPESGRIVFTVKKQGALLAKQVITAGSEPAPVRVDAAAGDQLFFDFTTGAPLSAASVLIDGAEVAATVHTPAEEGVYGRPYRGWASIGYNAGGQRATQPIRQSDLDSAEDIRSTLPERVDPEADREAFEQDPRVTPPNAIVFVPQPERNRWGSGEDLWISGGTVASSRLGGQSIGLPTAADVSGTRAVPRMSRSEQISVTGNIGGPVGSVGGSIATGTSTGELDYLDMNADGFPDVVGAGGIQYTDPTGVLSATRGGIPDGAVRSSENVTGNASVGSPARTITTGRGQAAPNGTGSANTSTAGNEMPPLGIGGSLGTGTSDSESDLLDINGDGLPDRVYENGRAALNLGYRFADPEPWPGGVLNDGSSSNAGVNIGFNTDFYGFAGGASFNEGDNSSSNTLADVNGDGLMDRVFTGSPIKVALNKGSGFAAPVPFGGSLDGLNGDVNAKLGAGAYFTIPIPIALGVGGFIIINPGADTSTGASRAEQMIRDINGDGYADHLVSDEDSELAVAANQTGRTNLLKSVERPMGSTIELGYTRDGNTYDQPGSRFVLSSVKTHDDLTGDGPDVQHATFTYSGGVQDRLEREFLGYGSITSHQRDRNGGVYRSVTEEYRTDGPYTRGLLKRQLTADGEGRLFAETLHTYELRNVATGQAGDGSSATATIFPMPVRTDQRWFEGRSEPGKQTRSEMAYDELGNLVRTVDFGEPGDADDVITTVGYAGCAGTYVVGVANSARTQGGGKEMRRSEGAIDCATGKMTQQRALLAGGSAAVTDVTYHPNGTIRTVTQPANHRGQRHQLTYGYDEQTGTYVTSTVDSFGYESSATYNLKFGEITTSTDINRQRLAYTHDDVGRIVTVTGPHDLGTGRPTIAFEYHPETEVPYAVTRHLDRASDGSVKADTIDTIAFTDGLGRIVQTKKDARIGGQDAMTVSGRLVFDEFGRTADTYYPTSEAKGAANTTFTPAFDTVRPATTSYDILDRTVRTVLPDETGSTTEYGFGQDRSGIVQFETAVTDAEGNTQRTYTDVRQQTTSVRQPGAADLDPSIWTSYDYDPLGQITEVTDDQDNVTTSAYDLLGRRTTITNPDSGRTTTAYDLAGNVIGKVTANLAARDQQVTYSYDFNRVEQITYPVFTANNVRYTYGGPGAEHNAAGRVATVKDAGGVTSRRYGPLGEIVSETRTLPASGPNTKTFTTGYRYDSFGRALQLTYPDGEVMTYGYDSGGQVISATGAKNGHTYPYLNDLHYDKFEQRTRMELGNGTTTTFSYDATDRSLAVINSTLPTGYTFQNLHYTYNDIGNITRLENQTQIPDSATTPKLGGPSDQTFTYDNHYRVTQASGRYDQASNKTDTYTYSTSYDTIQNITRKDQHHGVILDSGNEQVQRNTTYDNAYAYTGTRPHAPTTVGPHTMRYDANGNLIDQVSDLPGSPRRQMIWDEDNRLACVHDTAKNADQLQDPSSCYQPKQPPTVRFTYDDQGTRVVKDGPQRTLYPNQNYTARNQTEFKHVFIGTTRIATKTSKSGTAYEKDQFFYHGDQLGSATFGTDGTGQLAEHVNFFPSGELWVDERPSQRNAYLFTGKEYDPETGYYYHGARYYDPRTSLWKSADPIIDDYLSGSGNDGVYKPANLNLYGYTYNNPVNNTDPDGNLVFLVPVAILIGKGAMAAMTAYTAAQTAQQVYTTAVDVYEGRKTVEDAALEATTAVAQGVAEATVGKGIKAARLIERGAEWVGNTQVGRRAIDYVAARSDEVAQRFRRSDAPSGCSLNSFTPGTGVLMADGSTKPIEDIQIGDEVLATDPETGRTEPKAVTRLITGEGEKDLVKITVGIDGKKTDAITATDGHPFWVENLDRWLDAEDLKPGMWLRTSAGTLVQVKAVKQWTAQQRVHNLTVDDIHTYYVLAGQTPVLVHNTNGDCGDLGENWTSAAIHTIRDSNCCTDVARRIKSQIGGDYIRITDGFGAPQIGKYRGVHSNWHTHYAVRKDGRVYDAWTGRHGEPEAEYRKHFEYGNDLKFERIDDQDLPNDHLADQ